MAPVVIPAAVTPAAASAPSSTGGGLGFGVVAMLVVGSSAALSHSLADAPLFTAQALRYVAACLLLVVAARVTGQRVQRPRGLEWCWLSGVAGTGLVLFNVALVRGSEHAEPAVLGVAVACVPLLLAVLEPLTHRGHAGRQRPRVRVVVAAVVVTAGAVLVQGGGRSDAVGLGWALVVLACEAGFTLLALPVLPRLGAWGLSVHATWIAAVLLAVLGVSSEGPLAITQLSGRHLAAMAYLAIAVTALAFVLWYTAVRRAGAARAGLLTGLAPVGAAVSGILLGRGAPGALVWTGVALVALGLALGLRADTRSQTPARRPGPAKSTTTNA